MCLIVLSSVDWLLTYFSTLSNQQRGFRRKVIQHEIRFDILYKFLYETFHILRRIQRGAVLKLHRSSCKVPVILVRFQWNLNFLNIFAKNAQISNPIETRPVGAELLHVHGQTDQHDAANRGFSQFCESALKKKKRFQTNERTELIRSTVLNKRTKFESVFKTRFLVVIYSGLHCVTSHNTWTLNSASVGNPLSRITVPRFCLKTVSSPVAALPCRMLKVQDCLRLIHTYHAAPMPFPCHAVPLRV
jgi:hypothetical protein